MWKKKMNRYLIAFLILALTPFCNGQDQYDIQSLINRVLEENYMIRVIRNEALILENNNSIGNAGFLPTVDAQLTRSESKNNVSNEYFTGIVRESDKAKSDNLNSYVLLNWRVFDGFRMFAKREQLGLLQEMGALDARYYIEQTVSDIANAWYQLVKEYQLLDNFNETLEISRFRLFLEKRKLDIGTGNGLLYNQALVDYNTDSLAIMSQKRLIKSLVIKINQIAKNDPEQDLIPSEKNFTVDITFEKDSLIKKAIEGNQNIKQAMIEEMIAETNIRLMRASYYPEVNLYGQYSFNKQTNEVGTIQYGKTYGRQLGVTVRFNLFNGFNDKLLVDNSKISLENRTIQKENTIMQIKSVVLDNYYQHASITQQLIIADQNIITAGKSLDIAKAQYEQGLISGFDFRETQLSLIRAQNAATSLRYNSKSIEIELLRLSSDILQKYGGNN